MNTEITSKPVLSMRGVGVCFIRQRGLLGSRKIWALKDVNLDVLHGETLGVIGRNGAGKSTILRLIAGIIRPDSGEIINYGGYSSSLLALQVGFLPYLTGRENIYLSGMLQGLSRQQINERLDRIIDFSEIGEVIDYPVRTYSVGIKARLGFAISFQVDSDVLLIDEVLGVGDAQFKAKSAGAMREKILSNKTVVLVSHSRETMEELCNRVVWIENGSTREIGEPVEVLSEYEKFTRGKL